MMAIGKAEMADHLSQKIGLSKREANDIVNHFFTTMMQELCNGNKVKISGFGNFNLLRKNERPGRNPKTGDPVTVSARQVVTFRAGQKLRALLNKQDQEC